MSSEPGAVQVPWPSTLRGVLFDLDGVLVDSARAWHRVLEACAKKHGYPPIPWETFRLTFGQGPDADQGQFFPGVTVEEVTAFYDRAFPEELGAVELMAGAESLLKAIGEMGLGRAVVTNTPLELAQKVLERTGLRQHLEALAAAGEAPEKPAPDLVLLALGRLGLTPGEALYVGDSESDRRAARSGGIFMVGFRREGDATIEDLHDLHGLIRGRQIR